jgi:hypothetical protein
MPAPKLEDRSSPPAVIIKDSNTVPSEGETQSFQTSQQQIIPSPWIVVRPPESNIGKELLDKIARIGFVGFTPLINSDAKSPQPLFAQRQSPPTQAKDTNSEKAQTETTNRSERDTTVERPPNNKLPSITNSYQREDDPIEIETLRPATPKINRSLVIFTPSSDDLSGTLNTVAPPLSWNLMASPAHKSKDVFENLLPMPSVSPLKQAIDSPLVPPITPTHLLNDSSSNIAVTEKDIPIKSQNTTEAASEINTKPTCLLNLICYRSGTKGYELY